MTKLPPARTFEQWLDALITAPPEERRMLAIEGGDAGLNYERVLCVRHKTSLNWLSAFSHLDRTEASHRLQHGAGTRLHEPGDLVRTLDPRKFGECRWCGGPVVWASTASGKSMPVDAEPDPRGNVVLVSHPEKDRPLAVVLHTEFERSSVAPDSIHTSHMQTCHARSTATATKSTGRTET